IQVYEAMLRLDPGDGQALNNIGFNYWQQGDFERAGEYYRRAREADSTANMYAANVGAAWANLGELEKADSAYTVLDEMPRSPLFEGWRAQFEYERGNEQAARAKFEALGEEYASQSGIVRWANRQLGRLELLHGRLQAAEALHEGIGDAGRAHWRLFVLADTAGALSALERAIEDESREDVPVLNRPWIWFARIAAWAGDPGLARGLVARRDAEVSPRYLEIERRNEHDLEAWIALAEGDPERALSEMRLRPPDQCPKCRAEEAARLFEALGQADSAIARYREYIETQSNFSLFLDATQLAPAHESLGRLYDEKGDLENAALHYAQFVELWGDADPILQPRVEAARTRLQAIVRERG
ncbi:MAG: tetratricopeptide repeat protein, partial [Gemmatimonadetes bacterium]|nr:tetratricopeptide repeat protein [Gemmatimonadota bacterium]